MSALDVFRRSKIRIDTYTVRSPLNYFMLWVKALRQLRAHCMIYILVGVNSLNWKRGMKKLGPSVQATTVTIEINMTL